MAIHDIEVKLSNIMGQRDIENRLVNLRALAIILVVLGHSIILYSSSWNLYETNQSSHALDSLKSIINMIQMPLFIAIAGYSLYFTLQRYDGLGSFLLKKVRRVLVPFIIIGIGWMIPFRLVSNYQAYQHESMLKIVADFLCGRDSGHLWFLPTLFLIFWMCGFIVWISKNNNQQKLSIIFAVLSIIFIVVRCTGVFIPSYIGNAIELFPFFAEGYFIHVWQAKINTKAMISINVALLVVSSFIFRYVSSFILFAIIISMSCIALLFTLASFCYSIRPWVELLSKDSMGIYLFHSPMIYTSFAFAPDIPPILMLILNFFGFGCVAIILTELLRSLRLQIVLGE